MPTTKPRATTSPSPQSWTFTLLLTGPGALSDALADALFAAGCADALLGSQDGVLFLDFDREANSFKEAVLSAIVAVEQAGIAARVVRVETDDLVTPTEIARRTKRTRESVRRWVTGQRGPGNFPRPVANGSKTSPLWRWGEVARWLTESAKTHTEPITVDSVVAERAALLGAINATLELRRYAQDAAEARQLFEELVGPIPA